MIEKECPVCGKIYHIRANRIKHGRGTTCSRSCSYILRGKNQQQRVTTQCKRCGKIFDTTPHKIANGRGIYCSRRCQYPPHIITCAHCGKTFRTPPSGNILYCSTECFNAAEEQRAKRSDAAKIAWQDEGKRQRIMEGIQRRSQNPDWQNAPHFQRGENHPRYKGNRKARQDASRYEYKAWRKGVLRRDNFTCQHCHVRGGILVAHHIKHWATHPESRFDIDNGMTLCVNCHNKIHGKRPTD